MIADVCRRMAGSANFLALSSEYPQPPTRLPRCPEFTYGEQSLHGAQPNSSNHRKIHLADFLCLSFMWDSRLAAVGTTAMVQAPTGKYFQTKYDVNLAIFKTLKNNNITIPFPQWDVNIIKS